MRKSSTQPVRLFRLTELAAKFFGVDRGRAEVDDESVQRSEMGTALTKLGENEFSRRCRRFAPFTFCVDNSASAAAPDPGSRVPPAPRE